MSPRRAVLAYPQADTAARTQSPVSRSAAAAAAARRGASKGRRGRSAATFGNADSKRGKTPRTREHFPRMKDRAYARREGPIVSWGGGMSCPCGERIEWGHVRRREMDQIEQILESHEYTCNEGV